MGKATTDEKEPVPGVLGQALSLAEKSEFFAWFHLAPYEAPQAIGGGTIWHGYRPTGPKFHDVVTLNLETDQAGVIGRLTLCLDRQFIDSASSAPFARISPAAFWSGPSRKRIGRKPVA
jgi:hypothetical protein